MMRGRVDPDLVVYTYKTLILTIRYRLTSSILVENGIHFELSDLANTLIHFLQ